MLCLPLSFETEILNSGNNLLFFTEPICIIITLLCGIYLLKNRKNKIELTTIDWLTAIFLSSVIISTLFSANYLVSVKYTLSLFWYFIAGYLVIRLFNFSPFERRLSIYLFVIGTALLSAYACYNFYKVGIFHEKSYGVAEFFIPQGHTDLTAVLESTLLICIIAFFIFSKHKIKILSFVAISITMIFAVIIFSASKASYGAVLISFSAIAGCLLMKKPKMIMKLSFLVVPILLVIGIWKVHNYIHIQKVQDLPNSHYQTGGTNYDANNPDTYKVTDVSDEIFNQSLDTTKNHSNIERVNRLNAGIYMYQDHPSFGLGMGTFPEKYLDFVNYHPEMIKVAERTYDLMNSHNLFLTWLVEGGLITFLSGVGVVLFALFWLISEYRKKNSFLKLLLIAYLVGFIFHGFFHDFGQNARIIIPFWVCLAIVSRQLVQRKTINSKA